MMLEPLPTLDVEEREDGIFLTWLGMRFLADENLTYTWEMDRSDLILGYQIEWDQGHGDWIIIDYMEGNNPHGPMEYEINNYSTNALNYYKITPVYKGINYENNNNTMVLRARSNSALFSDGIQIAPVAIAGEDLFAVPGATVYFDASASYDADGVIVSYHWDFGDGGASIDKVCEHVYSETGDYVVSLTVTDDDGLQGSSSIIVQVNVPPVAIIGGDTEGTRIEALTFDGSGSYDPDGEIVNYHWNLGEGSTANGISIAYEYFNPGEYTVTLTVTDDDGIQAIGTHNVTITNLPPIADSGPNRTGTRSEPITFDASSSSDPEGLPLQYHWDFGDGTTDDGIVFDHQYQSIGEFTVTLTVTDDADDQDSDVCIVTITNLPPVADVGQNRTGTRSEQITFDASSSSDPEGLPLQYHWDFGDGTTDDGIVFDHQYQSIGEFTVTLTVTDDADDQATDACSVTIINIVPEPEIGAYQYVDITYRFTGTPDNSAMVRLLEYGGDCQSEMNLEPDRAGYLMTSIRIDRAQSYSFEVTYSMGRPVGANVLFINISGSTLEENITILCRDRDTGYSDDGLTESGFDYVVSDDAPLLIPIDEYLVRVLSGDSTYTFDASGSADPDGAIEQYHWDFGDGISENGMVVNHTFTTPGNFNVTLSVTDNDGGVNSSCIGLEVVEPVNESSDAETNSVNSAGTGYASPMPGRSYAGLDIFDVLALLNGAGVPEEDRSTIKSGDGASASPGENVEPDAPKLPYSYFGPIILMAAAICLLTLWKKKEPGPSSDDEREDCVTITTYDD